MELNDLRDALKSLPSNEVAKLLREVLDDQPIQPPEADRWKPGSR